MMLEQSLISPNFLGKESFRWFIGITTKYKQIENGGYKAKVRIIGYHPDAASVIKDEELPWAHVLVPLNMGAGTGGTGVCFNSRGSETVIGFFMDGDNGQEPVIIGSLFSGYDIVHSNSFNEGTNGFGGFEWNKNLMKNPNNKRVDTGRVPNTNGTPSVANRVGVASTSVQSQGSAVCNNKDIVSIPPKCKSANGLFSKILTTLKKFLNTIQQAQRLINSTLSAISNIPALVQEVASLLSDLFFELIKKVRNFIIAKIYSALKIFLDKLLPKDIKLFKQIITDKLVDEIKCAFLKVIQKLSEFFVNFLLQLADKAINVPLCAAEALVGSVLSTVSNEIEQAIGPTLEQITNQIGSVLGPISGFVSQALSYVDSAVNFLSCDTSECTPTYDYQMNVGWIPQGAIENYEKILNYPSSKLDEGKQAAEKWIAGIGGSITDLPPGLDGSQFGGCDVTTLKCGLPNITFFGGGGAGAAGQAVVDSLGQLIGVNITNSGSGYTSPPYVSIEDPCGNGGGAFATAVIGIGTITQVIIDEPGNGYQNAGGSNPCTTNPIDSSGSEVIGYVVGVNILRTGVGYTSGDVITDSACTNDIEIYPKVDSNGSITDVNIVNPGTAVRVFPELTINSETGEGAVLQPILSFKPVESVTIETDKNKVEKVVLCAEDHGV